MAHAELEVLPASRPERVRLKVLLSAYACEPNKGSEPGVGWHAARQAARHHAVWVVTRANNRGAIDAALAADPVPGLQFIYYDLPGWARWWKRGPRGTSLYYYLWQLAVYPVLRRLHDRIRFDVAHHVTFATYWKPSVLAFLRVPFVWGPVGGGESAPRSFQRDGGVRGALYEWLRTWARWLGERDPLVRATARRSGTALASTTETAQRLHAIGASHVEILSQVGVDAAERRRLRRPGRDDTTPFRFLSIGNLLHLKGFHLGLRAFAASGLADAEYWLVGDGPYEQRLRRLAATLRIDARVQFCGRRPRDEALTLLQQCDVFVFPSLHDSGGLACLEAMAAGIPIVCLDLGGPAGLVTEATGFKIAASSPEQAVQEMAHAMRRLATDPELRTRMGDAAACRAAAEYAWERKAEMTSDLYRMLAAPRREAVG